MHHDWLEHFHSEYFALLEPKSGGAKRGVHEGLFHRAKGFQTMFQLLLQRELDEYHIVETGTLRNPGNWKDGQSAKLFTEFVDQIGGWVKSVDINARACQNAREHLTSPKFSVHCGDSVDFLSSQPDLGDVHLFYLDSYDVKWHNDHDSATHHLKEFCAIESHLSPGTIVAIDDNTRLLDSNRRTGKGRLIVEYLERKSVYPIYDEYQIIYQF